MHALTWQERRDEREKKKRCSCKNPGQERQQRENTFLVCCSVSSSLSHDSQMSIDQTRLTAERLSQKELLTKNPSWTWCSITAKVLWETKFQIGYQDQANDQPLKEELFHGLSSCSLHLKVRALPLSLSYRLSYMNQESIIRRYMNQELNDLTLPLIH